MYTVPSGPMVGEAALPIASWPRFPPPVTGVETSGIDPRCWPKSNVHLTLPWLPDPAGGAIAYKLPVMAVVYTVPSGASAGAILTVWPNCAWPPEPAWAVHLTVPFDESTAYSVPLVAVTM